MCEEKACQHERDLVEKAEKYLRSAEILLKEGDYESSVSRTYYAILVENRRGNDCSVWPLLFSYKKNKTKEMKILVNMGHPAHVHFFKYMIKNLERAGHTVNIVARDKDVTLKLLNIYGFKYEVISGYYYTMLGKMYNFIQTVRKLLKKARKMRPDMLIGVGDPYVAHVGKLIGKPSIVFTDTEDAKLANVLTFPFASVICTPSCFKEDLGRKHVRYNGYHELAYLHPNYFKPDENVLDFLSSENDKIIIVRFISWSASHDIGLKGIKSRTDFIRTLENYGRVFITSEGKLDKKLEKYRITITPEKIHSLLYYADLYIGEGGTMAAEAAILGTPSIHIESTSKGIATGELSGNFIELRDKYGLLYFYPDQNKALEKAMEILENGNSKKEWQRKRERLLSEKIDVTAWMTDFIERFPDSFYENKNREI